MRMDQATRIQCTSGSKREHRSCRSGSVKAWQCESVAVQRRSKADPEMDIPSLELLFIHAPSAAGGAFPAWR